MRSFVALYVGLVCCGGGGGGGGGVDGAVNESVLQYCVSQTNSYRAMNSKPALTESSALEAFAATSAMEDDAQMSAHYHFMQTSGGGIAFAENECPGWEGWNLAPGGDLQALVGQCLAAFYAEGPDSDYSTHGHYINMMGAYATLGCGIYQNGTTVTITQDYGNN